MLFSNKDDVRAPIKYDILKEIEERFEFNCNEVDFIKIHINILKDYLESQSIEKIKEDLQIINIDKKSIDKDLENFKMRKEISEKSLKNLEDFQQNNNKKHFYNTVMKEISILRVGFEASSEVPDFFENKTLHSANYISQYLQMLPYVEELCSNIILEKEFHYWSDERKTSYENIFKALKNFWSSNDILIYLINFVIILMNKKEKEIEYTSGGINNIFREDAIKKAGPFKFKNFFEQWVSISKTKLDLKAKLDAAKIVKILSDEELGLMNSSHVEKIIKKFFNEDQKDQILQKLNNYFSQVTEEISKKQNEINTFKLTKVSTTEALELNEESAKFDVNENINLSEDLKDENNNTYVENLHLSLTNAFIAAKAIASNGVEAKKTSELKSLVDFGSSIGALIPFFGNIFKLLGIITIGWDYKKNKENVYEWEKLSTVAVRMEQFEEFSQVIAVKMLQHYLNQKDSNLLKNDINERKIKKAKNFAVKNGVFEELEYWIFENDKWNEKIRKAKIQAKADSLRILNILKKGKIKFGFQPDLYIKGKKDVEKRKEYEKKAEEVLKEYHSTKKLFFDSAKTYLTEKYQSLNHYISKHKYAIQFIAILLFAGFSNFSITWLALSIFKIN